jgi:hypothetical protein
LLVEKEEKFQKLLNVVEWKTLRASRNYIFHGGIREEENGGEVCRNFMAFVWI